MTILKGLYGITSASFLSQPEHIVLQGIEDSCHAGLDILQYRQKSSKKINLKTLKKIQKICNQFKTIFIINDNINLAININADGVHLGKEDPQISEVRNKTNKNFIIGASCYNSLKLAKQAKNAGANYVAFGAMFASNTKPMAPIASTETVILAKKELAIPVCIIGGINKNNIQTLSATGCDMFAIVSGIFDQPNIYKATLKLKNKLIPTFF